MEIRNMVKALEPAVTKWRRELHQIPETGYAEWRTQSYLTDTLGRMNPDILQPIADTGLKCVFLAKGAASTIAFRSDIDALPIKEQSGCDFSSKNESFMHACGHDGHMTVLLGLAACVSVLRSAGQLHKNVVLLFQPAEEGPGGAERMIREGALLDPRPDEMYGLHLMPDVPEGCLSLTEGPMMAATREFDLRLFGKTAHGAMPHKGIDCVNAVCQIYTQMQTAVTRVTSPFEPCLFTCGKLTCGTRRNIIADSAEMSCMLRAYTKETLDAAYGAFENIAKGAQSAFGVKTELEIGIQYPAVTNPHELCQHAKAILGDSAWPQKPLLIAEDFSFYQQSVPALFAFLGIGDGSAMESLHSSKFHFRESALLTGVEFDLRLVEAEKPL